MHLLRYTSTALTVAAAALANPIEKRRVPNEDAVFAALEGLSPCFVSCFISESYWSTYDLWDSVRGFCDHPIVLGGFWIGDHLMQCAENHCPDMRQVKLQNEEWKRKNCP